jgi:ABC-type Fe3+-hydroxamate transport system substrate-binding protein
VAASSLADTLSSTLARAEALAESLAANRTPIPTVLVTYSADANGYWTFGPGTFGDSLIRLASGASISANTTIPYPELSGEQVLSSDPQYIVYGTGFGINETTYAGGPFWSTLSAVHDGRADGMNSNYFTEPDPTMILLGLPELVAILHPGTAL